LFLEASSFYLSWFAGDFFFTERMDLILGVDLGVF
jgi:hypothetical protein